MISCALEVDAAGREGVADEEVVGLIRIEVLAVLEAGVLDDRQRQPDRLRNHLTFQRSDRGLDRDGDLGWTGTGRRAHQPVLGMLAAEPAKTILGLTADRDEPMTGIHQRSDRTGRAALNGDAVELLVDGDRIGGDLLGGAVIPHADDLNHFPVLAGGIEHLVNALVAIAIDRGPRHAAHLENLPAIRYVGDQPIGPQLAQALLVDVDVDGLVGVERVVECHEYNAGGVGALDDRREGGRVLGVHDDRVVAGVDEVVDRGDLRGEILAGRDDLELLELGGDVGLVGIRLGGLDHLDPPGLPMKPLASAIR